MSKRQFVSYMIDGYKKKMFLLSVITVCFVFVNLCNPLIFSFMIDQVINNQPITNPFLKKVIASIGGIGFLQKNLWVGSIVIIIVYLLAGALGFLRRRMNAEIGEGISEKIRNRLYAHLEKLPYSYHVRAKTGDLLQRCTSDVNQIRRLLSGQLIELLFALTSLVIAAVVLYNIYPKMAGYALVSLPLIFVLAMLFFRFIHAQFEKVDEADGKMSDAIQSTINGTRVVKAFNREKYELEKCEKEMDNFRKLYTRIISLNGLYWGFSDTICLSQICLIVVIGILEARKGNITIGDFFVFISYESQIIWPMRNVGRILSDMGRVSVAMGRLLDILNEPEEDRDSGETPKIRGNITFEHVYFKYDDGEEYVLKDVSFSVKAGQTVALMGPTGSGKSSLVHLLTRLYDYTDGSVKLDDIELKEIQKKYLREQVGIVLQEPYLFSKSIMENIRIAKPKAELEEIRSAARIASMDEVIREFDQGYDTLVGEKGVTLSGGQKQRIAIARTILQKSPILIFDDSLSAVDTETDSRIRSSLKEVRKSTTTFLITHRCSSAMDADLIIVLEEGKVAQMGNHASLMKEEGLYRRIYEIQSQMKEVEESYEYTNI